MEIVHNHTHLEICKLYLHLYTALICVENATRALFSEQVTYYV